MSVSTEGPISQARTTRNINTREDGDALSTYIDKGISFDAYPWCSYKICGGDEFEILPYDICTSSWF